MGNSVAIAIAVISPQAFALHQLMKLVRQAGLLSFQDVLFHASTVLRISWLIEHSQKKYSTQNTLYPIDY